ncbi:unnamed protein product [Clavelina lepadiformis]|uniref:Uncharacterized protein n=1 Tax=Clavelina lepadiformis TaxID=159417 RepID=A0ABP0GHP1_CLALP
MGWWRRHSLTGTGTGLSRRKLPVGTVVPRLHPGFNDLAKKVVKLGDKSVSQQLHLSKRCLGRDEHGSS